MRPHTSSTVTEAGALFALVDLSFHQKLSHIKLADEKLALIRVEGLQAAVFRLLMILVWPSWSFFCIPKLTGMSKEMAS